MTDYIKVKAAIEDGRALLWEKHPDHPNGEIFIAGNGAIVEVARTIQVNAYIEQQKLVVVKEEPEKQEEPEPIPPSVQPIEGYDDMTAADIVELLPTLTDEEKAAIAEYEATNKNRSTVLKELE